MFSVGGLPTKSACQKDKGLGVLGSKRQWECIWKSSVVGESLGCQKEPEVKVRAHGPLCAEACLERLSAKQSGVYRVTSAQTAKHAALSWG